MPITVFLRQKKATNLRTTEQEHRKVKREMRERKRKRRKRRNRAQSLPLRMIKRSTAFSF